ncbi:MAG: FAD-dependent monooxygenase, partial [Candidatus Eremiobacteraeota bacterium]|nr:FAD-dependent monooxygenase [Candidatus Eremiobacteraeota bacterium]
MTELLIAGAGPAGSAAALLAARRGIATTIIERSVFPRAKVCGEYLSPSTVEALHALGVGPSLASCAAEIDGVLLIAKHARAQIRFTRAGWSLPRSTLDERLLQAALDAGAALVHARVEDCTEDAGAVHLRARLSNGDERLYSARILIAADGMQSTVARKLRLTRKEPRAARFAAGGHFANVGCQQRFIEMYVDGSSYLAINPFRSGTANVMLIVNRRELREHGGVDAAFERRTQALAPQRFAQASLLGQRIAIGPL